MIENSNPTRLIPWLLAALGAVTSLGNPLAMAEIPRGAAASDTRLQAIAALGALAPHASVSEQAKVFARLIGAWDVEYTDFAKDGKQTHRSGEFVVGWILDGRAVQDMWIVYPSGERTEREVYTDLRYYDPKSQTWPSTFIDPENASVARFTGTTIGDETIVLDTRDFGNSITRWSVNGLSSNSFLWREEVSLDEGKTWRVTAEHRMKRRITRRT